MLTVDSAVIGYCTYQASDFAASDHVEKLIPKFPMNVYVAMFMVTIINLERYRYNYGRKCSQRRLRQANFKIPVTCTGEPNYDFMKDYIRSSPLSANLT